MKRFLVVLFFGLTMVFSASAFGDGDMCGCGKMGKMDGGMMGGEMMEHGGMMGGTMEDHHRMMHMMMTSLGLDEKQKEAIADMKHRVMKEIIRKKADKKIAEIELRELTVKDPMDMKAVEAKMKQIEGMRTDIHMMLIRAKEEVRAKLTPDQKKKLKEMMERRHMMGGMDDGMKHGMGGGMEKGMMGGCMGKGMMSGDMKCGCMGGEGKCGCMEHQEGKPEEAEPHMEHKH